MNDDYKAFHEKQMMSNNGTSVVECEALLSSVPFFVFFASWVSSYVSRTVLPVIEFLVIVVPVIFNVTVFSEVNHIVLLNIFVLFLFVLIWNLDPVTLKKSLYTEIKEDGKISLTYYRACTNLFSAICIFSVDFNIFPRRFAKTESFGCGFMDLGVGFFLCSNGLVENYQRYQGHFYKLLKKTVIYTFLGIFRLLLVKSLDYHELHTEYGVHWNFFFTLSICHLIVLMIIWLTNYGNPLCLAIILAAIHQTLLFLGLEEWVLLDAQRDTLISANKEGFISLLGFVSLYFAAISIAKFIVIVQNITYINLIKKLFISSLLAWMAMLICQNTIGISRRLANLGYILWILASTLTVLILFFLTKLTILVSKKKSKTPHTMIVIPLLLQSINANGLFFFLLGNFLTGAVNILIETFLANNLTSMVIILIYMSILCGATYILFTFNIFIKL